MEQKAQAFAEEAIRAIGRLDAPHARTSIAQADAIDHSLGALADAVHLACAEIEEGGRVSTSTWNTLADAVGPGRLLAVVESSRTI
jgi:hypothetical protein